jgi:uncharacterized membrane protein
MSVMGGAENPGLAAVRLSCRLRPMLPAHAVLVQRTPARVGGMAGVRLSAMAGNAVTGEWARNNEDTMAAPDHAHESKLDDRAVDRLVFFTDAVVAIIITLMVLEVRLPSLPAHTTDAEVLRALVALWPKYLAVALSFLVIGLFWTLHHRRFNWVRRVDNTLVWLDLLYLLALACVPFATSLTAEHPGRTSTIVYAGVLGAASLIATALWGHVGRRPEIMANVVARREMHLAVLMSLASAGVFLGSIGVAFANPRLAQYLWVLVFFANRAVRLAYDWRHPREPDSQ